MSVLSRREKLSAVLNESVSGKTRRRLYDDLRKSAAQIGGDPQSGFEKSFASLAYTYVRDRAPSLMDHLVGFQLIDRNDDGSKAAGLFGFRVGDQWLYVPSIFLNGEVKGHELLNLKNQDLFVPLKENWVDFLLQQRPSVLGEGSARTMSQLGVRQPDYESLAMPPTSKYGEYRPPALQPWVKDSGILVSFAKAITDANTVADLCGIKSAEVKLLAQPFPLTVDTVLRTDVAYVKAAMKLCDQYPGFKQALHHFYGDNVLRDAVVDLQKQAQATSNPLFRPIYTPKTALGREKVSAKVSPKLSIYTRSFVESSLLPIEDRVKEAIAKQGYSIDDDREDDEVSSEVKLEDFDTELMNPGQTGIYDVLIRPAKFRRCLVINNPHGRYGRDNFLTVVSLDDNEGGRNWCNADKALVFAEPQEQAESEKEQWASWYEGIGGSESLAEKGVYVAVTKNGQGTMPFEVESDQKDGNYRVYFRDYCMYRDHYHHKIHKHDWPTAVPDSVESVDQIRINNRKGTKLVSVGNTLYLPEDCKIIKLKSPPEPTEEDKKKDPCCCSPSAYMPDPPALQLGALADISMHLQAKTSELKVVPAGGEVWVNNLKLSKMSALFHLVRDYGLRADAAENVIKTAERRKGYKARVKLAQGYSGTPPMYVSQDPSAGMMFPDPSMQMSPVGGVPQMPYQEQTVSPQTMQAPPPDMGTYPDGGGGSQGQPTMQLAQMAQQTGRKEVFDTAAITAMLRSVREESIIDRFLDDLIRAVDRWGRILLNFYWHNEEFADRYGKQDLPELEDTIRNAFEVSGDGVLFLKQKTVKPLGLLGEDAGPDVSSAGRI